MFSVLRMVLWERRLQLYSAAGSDEEGGREERESVCVCIVVGKKKGWMERPGMTPSFQLRSLNP